MSYLSELSKAVTVDHQEGSLYAMINCPSPDHEDSSPSCHVNIQTGHFGCFSCGESGDWKRLAKMLELNENPEKGLVYRNVKDLYRMIRNNKKHLTKYSSWIDIDPLLKNWEIMEYNSDWRGIDSKTLNKFGVKKILNEEGFSSLVIPVKIGNITHGLIKAAFSKRKQFNYVYSSGQWIADYGLLGYNRIKNNKKFKKDKVIMLVEGSRDCMKCHMAKLPAIAILGAQTWTKTKQSFIEMLDPKKVLICLDGDNAGQKGAWRIKKRLRYIPTENIVLKNNKDPADLSIKQLKILYNGFK